MLESKDSPYELVAIEGYATHTCLGPCCGKRLSEAGLTSKDRDLRTLFKLLGKYGKNAVLTAKYKSTPKTLQS